MHIPQAVLNVYGAYPSQKVLQLNNNKEGFIVKGRTQMMWSEKRVVLAPYDLVLELKENYLKQCYAVRQVLLHLLS
jgi:hypothetical protein